MFFITASLCTRIRKVTHHCGAYIRFNITLKINIKCLLLFTKTLQKMHADQSGKRTLIALLSGPTCALWSIAVRPCWSVQPTQSARWFGRSGVRSHLPGNGPWLASAPEPTAAVSRQFLGPWGLVRRPHSLHLGQARDQTFSRTRGSPARASRSTPFQCRPDV